MPVVPVDSSPRSIVAPAVHAVAALVAVALGVAACSATPAGSRASEVVAPSEAKQLAERVIAAHGGADAWSRVITIGYEHELDFEGTDKPWRSRQIAEPRLPRRVYADYPSHGGSVAFDGRDVWSVDWKLDNPPRIMPYLTLYSLIAPFLALDQGIELAGPGTGTLPDDPTTYRTLTLKVPFDGDRPPVAGYYKLYVDPTSHEMKGLEYNVVFGHILDLMALPPEVVAMGPMTHVFTEMVRVDELIVPTAYWTRSPSGGVAGRHVVRDWSFRRAFDEARMVRPERAVVDRSSHARVYSERARVQ